MILQRRQIAGGHLRVTKHPPVGGNQGNAGLGGFAEAIGKIFTVNPLLPQYWNSLYTSVVITAITVVLSAVLAGKVF